MRASETAEFSTSESSRRLVGGAGSREGRLWPAALQTQQEGATGERQHSPAPTVLAKPIFPKNSGSHSPSTYIDSFKGFAGISEPELGVKKKVKWKSQMSGLMAAQSTVSPSAGENSEPRGLGVRRQGGAIL